MRKLILRCALAVCWICVAGPLTSCKDYQPSGSPSVSASKSASDSHPPQDISEPWYKETETDAVTGVVSKYSLHDNGFDNGITVRQVGKVHECFVRTGDFLETSGNVESHLSTVKYRFDDGKTITQSWILGENNESLFYPGKDCSPFIKQIMKSKTLAFQYKPAETIPKSITFDLRGFPKGFFDLI